METDLDNLNETSQKILECACEVFADKGFEATSISDICEMAGTNRASINYYFRSKENLYEQAYVYSWNLTHTAYKTNNPDTDNLTPAERLKAYISSIIRAIFSSGPEGLFMRMMFHEVIQPNIRSKDCIGDIIKKERKFVDDILSDLTGETDLVKLHFMNMSVMSQCLFFNLTRNIRKHKLEIKSPPFDRVDFRADEHLDSVIEHVYQFCMNGLIAGR